MFALTLAIAVFALTSGWREVAASQKKGYLMSFNGFQCGDFDAIGPMNWWYDMHIAPFYEKGSDVPNCTNNDYTPYDSSHVAMVWGWRFPDKDRTLNDLATAVIGFNEPNHFSQSNLTALEAAELWPKIEAIADGLPLASPSASPCSTAKCSDQFTWLYDFYGNCSELYPGKGCRVDYTSSHFYACNSNWMMGNLKQLYNKFGKPIWLTEFACSGDDAKVMTFMQEALPRLESSAFVERYSWFASRIMTDEKYIKSSASLFEADSSTLTPLGEYYKAFPNV